MKTYHRLQFPQNLKNTPRHDIWTVCPTPIAALSSTDGRRRSGDVGNSSSSDVDGHMQPNLERRKGRNMKRAAIYGRASNPDQHIESQLLDVRKVASQRGFEVIREYCDKGVSGSKAKRPGLDAMMNDARRGEFSVILVGSFDRIARSTKNFLEIVALLSKLCHPFLEACQMVEMVRNPDF